MLAAGKGGKSAIVIEVQNNAWDIPTAVRYAKHAAAHGADAIGAIPLNNGWNRTDQEILDYYKAIAAATDLPLIVQTRGTVSVDLMIQMYQQIPNHEGDQGRSWRYDCARERTDAAHRQQAGGLGGWRRNRQ